MTKIAVRVDASHYVVTDFDILNLGTNFQDDTCDLMTEDRWQRHRWKKSIYDMEVAVAEA